MMTSNGQDVRAWYDRNAVQFKDAIAIELAFTHLTRAEQERLNRFKLWFIQEGALVSLHGKRILEFGCGHGRLALEVGGYESYVGVDFSEPLIEIGRERIAEAGLGDRARLIVSDCLAFEAPPDHFDIVCSLGMFSHVPDPRAVLEKMYFHLAPGGTLFLDGHASSPLYNPLRDLKKRITAGTGGAKTLFRPPQLRALLADIGLIDVRVVMREYPLLGGLYARGWDWPMSLRNRLAEHPVLDVLGTTFMAFGRKPLEGGSGG